MRVSLVHTLSLVLASVGTMATAQVEQTAQGAQDFIRITATTGRAKIEIPRKLGLNRISYLVERECITSRYSTGPGCPSPTVQVTQEVTVPAMAMSTATATGTCETRFGLVKDGVGALAVPEVAAAFPDAWEVDWAAVQKIEQEGQSVTLSPNGARFWFQAEDIAVRFAYAATFLKDSCDPTAATGF